MEYLLKASAIIAIFYVSYKLFLQRDTFFEWNRGYLLMGLITAFTIPFIVIPIYIERVPIVLNEYVFSDNVTVSESIEKSFTLLQLLTVIYLLGVGFFFVRFTIQLSSLAKIIFLGKGEKNGDFTFIKTTQLISPFSFFKWIVYNPDLFSKDELEQIITHEKVHARQHHSIDILLTQLSCIALWFNPFVWFYNKDLKQNLEFIADQNAQNKSDCKKSYQYTLLKTSMPMQQLALTNNFYNSLIKKRIVMLHKSKSKKINQLKYVLIIPIIAVFLMSFNTKTIYIDKESPLLEDAFISNAILEDTQTNTPIVTGEKTETKHNLSSKKVSINNKATKNIKKLSHLTTNSNSNIIVKGIKNDTEVIIITKSFTKADFDKVTADLKEKGVTIKFKGIKRNKSSEITAIKIDVSSKNTSSNYNISSDEPIKPIKVSFDEDGNNISIGNASNIHYGVSSFQFKSDDGKHYNFKKSGKDKKNVFVFSSDGGEHEFHGDTIHVSTKGKKGKKYVIKKSKHVEVISDDNNEGVRVIIDSDDGEHEIHGDTNTFILSSDGKNKHHGDTIYMSKNGKKVKHIVVKGRKTAKVISNHFKDGEGNLIISGTVKANDGVALPGTNVIIKGTSFGTATDFDGNFKIKASKGDALVFSFIGFDSEQVNIKENTSLNITLSESANVKSGSVNKLSFSNDGEKPLIIVDDKETDGNIEDLNPNNIESMTVLKDKSATKKYGDKGKNGVILITTKSGRKKGNKSC